MTREQLIAHIRTLPEEQRQDLRVQLLERQGYHLDAGCSTDEAVRRGWDAFRAGLDISEFRSLCEGGRDSNRGRVSGVPAHVDPVEQWRRIAARGRE